MLGLHGCRLDQRNPFMSDLHVHCCTFFALLSRGIPRAPNKGRMESVKARIEAFRQSRAGLFVQKVLDDQAPNLASLLAWGTLSTLLPLLLGVLSLAGLVLRDPQTLDKVYSAVLAVMPQQAAGPLTQVIESMRQGSAAPAGIVAILLLLVTGSSFFANMASVFDQAYHVQGRNPIM